VRAPLDEGLELVQGTASSLFLGNRVAPGWAVQLVLVAALLPFFAAVVDLFALCRRRRIPVAPGLRSYRSRLMLWVWIAALFELFRLLDVWPGAPARPLDPAGPTAGDWPRAGLAALAVLGAIGWLVARDRLVPRRAVTAEEEVAGHTAALLALAVVALLVVVVNPFALVLLLPSLHAWLWLPQVRYASPGLRGLVFALGLSGPALLLASFGVRYGLGLDAPWYVLELAAIGYVPFVGVALTVAWLAATQQLGALVIGRYAPYPRAGERPRLGPIRRAVRAVVLAAAGRGAATGSRP
jgi:hypothetical protein